MEKHKYIKLLDYCVSKNGSYHMEPALVNANITESDFELIRDSIFINANTQAPAPSKNDVFGWRLRPEAVFGYLTYKQYEHAEKSAKRAMYTAVVSLGVAVLTLVVTAFGVWL